jgi:cystathionine gamma-synthase
MSEPFDRRRGTRGFAPLPEWAGVATRLIHGARRPDLNAGSVVAPIYPSTTFRYPPEYSPVAREGEHYLYAREGGPTPEPAAEILRQLEGGEAAQLFGSGMGALAATFVSLVRPGEEIVVLEEIYGGTRTFLNRWAASVGPQLRWIDSRAAHAPEEAIGEESRLVFLESPTNPLLTVHDIARWARRADAVGAILIVDNTFATPLNQKPLSLGADLVIHSATKYLGGHSDLLGGAVVGPRELVDRIDPGHLLGSVLDPWSAFLLHRSLKTLGLRVARQNTNARAVAEALRSHARVERVYYPGWNDASEEEIALRQMTGRGGMLSFDIAGGASAVHRFLHRLRLVEVASSLGGVESLVSAPSETSHRCLDPSERARLGIGEGLVRLSVGIEEPEDLIRDLHEALSGL